MHLFYFLFFVLSACERYQEGPKAWKQAHEERVASSTAPLQLTDHGTLPPKESTSVTTKENPSSPVDQKFAAYCSPCHGANGHGDTPMAASLKPKPRNFSDHTWQSSVTDEHLEKVIRDGGPSQGLSPLMAPWGHIIKGEELKQMVQKIRSFGK